MGLLDDIAMKLHLDYISDIKFIEDKTRLKACINSIPEKRYTLQEWQGAARYITEKETIFVSREEAKRSIVAGKII